MGRRPHVIPSTQLNLAVPEDLFAKLTLHLYSELEGRVPHGSYSRFLCERIREYFTHQHLELAPYVGSEPGALSIQGRPEAIAAIKRALEIK